MNSTFILSEYYEEEKNIVKEQEYGIIVLEFHIPHYIILDINTNYSKLLVLCMYVLCMYCYCTDIKPFLITQRSTH